MELAENFNSKNKNEKKEITTYSIITCAYLFLTKIIGKVNFSQLMVTRLVTHQHQKLK